MVISLSDTACGCNAGVEDFIERISSFGGEVTRSLALSSRDTIGSVLSEFALGPCSSGIVVVKRCCVALVALLVEALDGDVGDLTPRTLTLEGRAFMEVLAFPVLDVMGLDVDDVVDLDIAEAPEVCRGPVPLEDAVLVRGEATKGLFEVAVDEVIPSVVRLVLSWVVSGAGARRTGRLFSSPEGDVTAGFRVVVDAPGRAGGLLAVLVDREDIFVVPRRVV